MKRELVLFILGVLILSVFPIPTQQPTPEKTAKFVISSWSYPDEYGQGIESIRVYENLSVYPWLHALDGGFNWNPTNENDAFEMNSTHATGLYLTFRSWINNTVVGADDFDDGRNYIRHNITFTQVGGGVLFSQENFTYTTGSDSLDPMFLYFYAISIPFTPIGGLTYKAVVTCEIYF